MEQNDKIVIYQTSDGQTSIDVKLENETVWLTQAQMAELFQKDRSVISRHINNVFREGELDAALVCAKFAHTKDYGRRKGFIQQTETTLYNLDVIISVGYRVKSKRGTQFRIWANEILRDYLVKGYAINDKIAARKYEELSQLVRILGRTVKAREMLTSEDTRSLLNVVVDYNYALDTLDRYDYQQLAVEKTTREEKFHATYDNAMAAIRSLKSLMTMLPGRDFIRVHRSFAVPVGRIARFTRQQIELTDGTTQIPIGRMYADDVAAVLMK